MAATRLHMQFRLRDQMQRHGGGVDVFGITSSVELPLLLRPLKGLLGAYLPEPTPGILITTERPLSIQRFTAAHELGHFKLGHKPSLDDESILRRMALPAEPTPSRHDLQEVEADAFAVEFLMPRWLIEWHCNRQGWKARDLHAPLIAYQLALRLGTSFEAITWTLQRHNLIDLSVGRTLRQNRPRELKVELLRDYKPTNYRGDVWLLTERDGDTKIDGSSNDHFVLRLPEHNNGGYLWNIDQLKA